MRPQPAAIARKESTGLGMSFSLHWIDWCVCLVVLGFSVFLGLYLAVRRRSSLDSAHFFLADRSLSWPLVGASLFATNIGAEHLVGLSGDSYRYGLAAGTVELTTCICVVVADADAHHARAQAAGAEIIVPPHDNDGYPGRGYDARDPEGNVWSIGTYDPWAD